MQNARRDGLYLVLLGCAVFLLFGIVLEIFAPHPLSDFRFVYNGARCVLQGIDPYKPADFQRVMVAQGADLSGPNRKNYLEMSHYMYPPTSLILAPLALLPWVPALTLWSILIAAVFITAAFLMWQVGAEHSPILSGCLVFLMLVGNQSLLVIGNPDGVVVSACVIAAWCFVKHRFTWLGVMCLAVALLLKPHDAGLVWFYFLLARGMHRRYALRTLGVTVVLGTLTVLWISLVAPAWLSELRSNLAFLSARGHLNDPGPTSLAGHGIAMVVNLQAAVSVFRDDPRLYNPISLLVCAILLVIWLRAVVKAPPEPAATWLALAVVSALTMLPVYHRLNDAKLLLLTVPACALLYSEGARIGRLALTLNSLAFFLTGSAEWAIGIGLLRLESPQGGTATRWLLMAVQVFPVPLILLAISAFYLWVLVRRPRHNPSQGESFAAA